MVPPQCPSTGLRMSGSVMLTPMAYSHMVGMERGEVPAPPSKRELAARLAARKREDAVLAPQRAMLGAPLGSGLDLAGFDDYLRTGRPSTPAIDQLGQA